MEAYGGGKPPTEAGAEKVVFRDLGLMLFEPANGVAAISAPPTWASRAGYHVRGQSSASFPKTPYRVELWDENNEDIDKPMIGMPGDADWAMIGEYSDKTLVRNAFSFSLAVEMGLNAPEMRFAEVYINQDEGPLEAEDYQGVYAVTETIKNKSDRLNLKQLKPTDTEEAKLSGGYIFKFDMAAVREDEGEIEIPCTGDADTCFEDLELTDPVEPNAEQLAWIADYVSRAHATLVAEPVGDYAQYLDVKSFVDMLVLNELTKGGDKYVRSVYLHKDRDQLITAGPAWDYNFTLGNLVNDVEGWQVDSSRDDGTNWFQLLFAQPEIKTKMAARWFELRQNILSNTELEARIDRVSAPIVNAGPRDLERWPVTAGGVFGGGFGGMGGMAGGIEADAGQVSETPLTWQGHVDEMKEWIRVRTAWLDAEYATF
jgi:CotH kinase protein